MGWIAIMYRRPTLYKIQESRALAHVLACLNRTPRMPSDMHLSEPPSHDQAQSLHHTKPWKLLFLVLCLLNSYVVSLTAENKPTPRKRGRQFPRGSAGQWSLNPGGGWTEDPESHISGGFPIKAISLVIEQWFSWCQGTSTRWLNEEFLSGVL